MTVGQSGELSIKLEVGAQDAVVNISGDAVQLVETGRTNVGSTIDQRRIENLPINERSIDVQVNRLRRKIETDPKIPRYLQTVRGAGYVLRPD